MASGNYASFSEWMGRLADAKHQRVLGPCLCVLVFFKKKYLFVLCVYSFADNKYVYSCADTKYVLYFAYFLCVCV